MKRWLSYLKRHVIRGNWTQPAKERRPLTIFTTHSVRQDARPCTPPRPPSTPTPQPADYYVTAPLVPLRHPRPIAPPLCDVDLIMARYAGWSPSPAPIDHGLARASSQALPAGDVQLRAQAYVDYAFISFEPAYKVTVSEVEPYRLSLRKPRFERMKKAVSFLAGGHDGKIRFSFDIHAEE